MLIYINCGDDSTESEQCLGPSQSTGASSTCIETIAYTLQALTDNADIEYCLLVFMAAKQKTSLAYLVHHR